MMAFRKLIRFVVALVLGLVLTLISYPVYSQDLPSFKDCVQEVESYPDEEDLTNYSERQVYCLFVVELLEGGVDPEREYYNAELFSVIMTALRNTDDAEDDKLTYQEITKLFPGSKLNELINESIDQAEIKFSLSQSSPVQVASVRLTPDSSPSSFTLAQGNGRVKGEVAVKQVSTKASQRK